MTHRHVLDGLGVTDRMQARQAARLVLAPLPALLPLLPLLLASVCLEPGQRRRHQARQHAHVGQQASPVNGYSQASDTLIEPVTVHCALSMR